MAKNIVICCDGTAGKFGQSNTNVVKLCEVLQRDQNRQILFYQPGLGTFSVKPVVSKVAQFFYKVLGLAFGVGLTKNMLEAYAYLMEHYSEGDRIFIFGFSRGAYTARAIAALIHNCGLLYPGSENLLPYAADLFKQKHKDKKNPQIGMKTLEEFKRIYGRNVDIKFLGLWDTVTSVGWVWNPQVLPNTATNENVEVVRHAIAIDERRAFFKQNLWNSLESQDVKQVWFPGTHSDVGGGIPDTKYGLAKMAFEWMLVEARRHGLLIDDHAARRNLNTPAPPTESSPVYPSLNGVWWLCEYVPKIAKKRNDEESHKSFLFKLSFWASKLIRFLTKNNDTNDFISYPRVNNGRPRFIKSNALIHESADIKRRTSKGSYNPEKWPDSPVIEPWEKF